MSIHDAILHEYKQSLSWTQSFVLPPGESGDLELDLCCSVGPNARPPYAPDQPKRCISNSCYRFPVKYRGSESWTALLETVKHSLPGSNFILTHGTKASKYYQRRVLHCCHFLSVEASSSKKEFDGDSYIQSGVRKESIKSQKNAGGLTSLDLMSTKTQLKSMKASRSNKTSRYSQNQPNKRRTSSNRAPNKESKCECRIVIVYNNSDGYFYLDIDSNLYHTGHRYIPPSAKLMSTTEVNEDLNVLISRLANVGVTPSKISDFVSQMEDIDSTLDNKSIRNMIQKETQLDYSKIGITSSMSSADRAIAYLNQ